MRKALKLLLLLGVGVLLTKDRSPDGTDGTSDDGDDGDSNPGDQQNSEERDERLNFEGKNASQDMAGVHGEADEATQDGRATDADGDGDPDVPSTTDSDGYTDPSGTPDPNNKPRGEPEEVKGNGEKKRGIRRQNESAETLAEHGYDVEQSPPGKENGKNPDYKIEGEYFDCYAPKTGSPDNIRGKISEKISGDQTERIVLNLDDSPVDQAALRSLLERSPIEGLEEIKIVKDGQVINFYPF